MQLINRLKHFCSDLFFPVFCLGCGEHNDRLPTYLCQSCLDKIPLRERWECAFCQSPNRLGKTCGFCLAGQSPAGGATAPRSLDYLWSATDYRQPVIRQALAAHKYNFVQSLTDPLSQLVVRFLKKQKLLPRLEQARNELILVPVPLHRQRLNYRSFNQSALLASAVGAVLNCPVTTDLLTRPHSRKHQADIKDLTLRQENISGVFALNPAAKLKDKTILLFDDVATSGSTLDECARLLKQAGASEVIGITIAKG